MVASDGLQLMAPPIDRARATVVKFTTMARARQPLLISNANYRRRKNILFLVPVRNSAHMKRLFLRYIVYPQLRQLFASTSKISSFCGTPQKAYTSS